MANTDLTSLAIQECRDRALPDNSDFAGLAEIGNQEGFDVHTLDDRSREDDGLVRMTAPGHQTPTVGARATSSSTRKSTSTSIQTASSSAAQRTPNRNKSSKAASIKIPAIPKFGPPKGKKRDDMPNGSAIKEGASRIQGEAQGGADGGGAGRISRGPTPPTSRPSTPTPTAAVEGSSSVDSSAIALTTIPSDLRRTPPPAVTLVRRATSLQPAPSMPAPILSAVRAQSAKPSIGAQSVALKAFRLEVGAAPPAAATFIATPFAAAAAATSTTGAPPAPMPSTPAISAAQSGPMPADEVDPGSSNAAILTPSAPSAADQAAAVILPPQLLTGSVAVPNFEKDMQVEILKGGRKRKGTANTKPAAKKRRLSDGRPTPSTSGAADASSVNGEGSQPLWVVNALRGFPSTSLGPGWDTLLRNWLQFEQDEGYQDCRRLGSRNRPRIIADWIQWARKPTFKHEIKNQDIFAEEFNAWWRGLQPAWRIDNASDLLRRDGDDWTCLRCSGVNGLLSVLAALYFWGCHVQPGTVAFKSRWSEALDDVSYAISKLL